MSCEDNLKRGELTTLDRKRRRRKQDMIQALKNTTGKEAVYSGRGSWNGHQARQLGTNIGL